MKKGKGKHGGGGPAAPAAVADSKFAMKRGKHAGGGPAAPAAPAAIADPRFARVQSDPRFRRMPKDEAKASIDKRFSVMFKDRKFAEPAAADKRGRAKKKKEKHLLHRYYKVGEGQEEAGAAKKMKDADSEEEEDDEEEEDSEEEDEEEEQHLKREDAKKKGAKQINLDSEEEDEEDSDEEDEEEEEEEDEESSSSSSSSDSEVEEVEDPRDEEAIPTAPGAERRRFAIMNMDWEHVKAVDLLMLMRSFQPKGGHVECVSVYPSDFGIEQLKKDEVHGPSAIFEEDDEDEDKEVNMEKLRAYEKNKLKYYYAVVECDSKETANHLYTQCDGLEFERTSNTLDLRFIPDEMTFTRAPRDVARDVQDGYKAPEYETRALQHSTVKLTWDDDEPTRVKALRKKFNAEELNEMDFRAYLASESSEEELEGEEEEESLSSPERGEVSKSKKDKYRSLLLGDAAEVELPGQRKKKGDVDMEVTFHTGLSELSEKLMQKKEAKKRGDETVWEAYLRKKKEKKSQRKRSKNAKGSDDDYTSEEDVASPRGVADNDHTGFDDPFFADAGEFADEAEAKAKKSSKKKEDKERLKKREEKEQQKKEEEKSKAELELLLMDDQGVEAGGAAARGFNLKSKKKKEKKKKKDKDDPEAEEEEDKLATAELTDPRFATLFTDHRYAVDPDNSQFWKSDSHRKIMSVAAKRKMQQQPESASAAPEPANDGSQDRKRKAELSSLVRSLKRKAGKKSS